jgi:hypothetical protein
MDSEFGYEREYKDDDVDDESDLDYYGENICEGVCLGGSFIKPMSIINEEEDYNEYNEYNEEDLEEYEEYEDDSNDP